MPWLSFVSRRRASRVLPLALASALAWGGADGLSWAATPDGTPPVAVAPAVPGGRPQITIGRREQTVDSLTLSDVRVRYPGAFEVTITFRQIALSGLDASTGRLKGRQLTLSGVAADIAGFAHIDADSLTATDIESAPVTEGQFTATGPAGTMPPIADWMLGFKAALVRVPTMRIALNGKETEGNGIRAGAGSAEVTYQDIVLSGIDAGRIANTAVAGVIETIASPGKPAAGAAPAVPPVSAAATIGPLTVQDTDLNAYAAWVDDARAAAAPRTRRTLYRSATLDGMTIKAGPMTTTVGKVVTTSFKLGPPPMRPSELIALLAGMPKDGKPTPEQTQRLFGFVRGMLQAFEIGSMEMSGLKVTQAAESPVSIGSLKLSQVEGLRVGEFRLDDLATATPDGTALRLGSFALRGFEMINFETAMDQLAAGVDPKTWTPDQYPHPRFSGLAISGVDSTVPGQGHFTLGSLTLDMPDWTSLLPTALTMHLQGLTVPAAAVKDEAAKKQLDDLGLETVGLSANTSVAWHEGDTLTIDPLSFDVEGVGRVAATATLGGVPKRIFDQPQTAEEALASVDVRSLSLKLDDGGSFAKLLDQTAAERGTTRAAMAQQVSQMAEGGLIMFLGMQDAGHSVGTALRAFITDPKSLSVMLTAAPPLPALVLGTISNGDPATLDLVRKSLTIEATANK